MELAAMHCEIDPGIVGQCVPEYLYLYFTFVIVFVLHSKEIFTGIPSQCVPEQRMKYVQPASQLNHPSMAVNVTVIIISPSSQITSYTSTFLISICHLRIFLHPPSTYQLLFSGRLPSTSPLLPLLPKLPVPLLRSFSPQIIAVTTAINMGTRGVG